MGQVKYEIQAEEIVFDKADLAENIEQINEALEKTKIKIDEVEGKIGEAGTDALRKQLSNKLDLLDKQKKELEELSRLKEIEQEKQEQS